MTVAIRVLAVAFVFELIARAPVAAQQPAAQSTVRVTVVDSAGSPLANADVSVVEGLSKVITNGSTDATGSRTLVIPASGKFQIVVRRLGYLRGNQFFSATPGSVAVRVQLAATPASLPSVAVTASANPYYHAYHVGADEIAASDRPIFDAVDVMNDLRPDMMNAYTPPGIGPPCSLQNVWVNGQRITLVPTNDRLLMEKTDRQKVLQATAPRAQKKPVRGTPPPAAAGLAPTGIASASMQALSILASIHSEHIEEINYEDCKSTVVERAHAQSAAFVVLKPGVKFEPGRGSYVDDVPLAIAANRMRIIGVFDHATGAPLPDVEVTDESGTSIKTSETGTATLAFLPDGTHTLRIRKSAYAEQTIDITISAVDIAPITLTLAAAKER